MTVPGLLGRKLGMTEIFSAEGYAIPVTVVQAECYVVQIKRKDHGGYNALQLGFLEKKEGRVNNPLKGHFKKAGTPCFYHLKEFKVDDDVKEHSLGSKITVDIFKEGERIDVTGMSKGRGFAGVMKRWGFRGGPATHGSMFHRAPGSIGASSFPSRVFKGKKLPGHYGNERVTVKKLKVLGIRPLEGIILLQGAVPGAKNGLLILRKPLKKEREVNAVSGSI